MLRESWVFWGVFWTGFIFSPRFFNHLVKYHLYSFFFKILLIFRERGREEVREEEKHQCVVAAHAPPLRTWPTTQACALTGN